MGFLDSLGSGEDKKSAIDVLMELLNKENIEMKTDLNISQIKVLWQSYFFTELLKEENMEEDPFKIFQESLVYFMQLMTSIKRKRAEEIIQGVSKMREEFLQEMTLIGKLAGGG